jgi:signal transduction histidine kinase
MRMMVGALRDGGAPDLTPQRGIADLDLLARPSADTPQVRVTVTGDLTNLSPALNAAVFRLAQESVTNALRHARHARRVDVTLIADDATVRLRVADDGDQVPVGRSERGYGLVGMAERVALLEGTFDAGPGHDGGWTVSAVLPRTENG